MAANYLVIGSKFKPFSYEEILAPVLAAEQEHQRQEELYNTYSDALGQIGAQLSREYDSELLDNIYTPYRNAVESAAEELASNGLTAGSRKTINTLRRQYNNEIVPIQQGILARAEARKLWDEKVSKDPTLMTNANPYYQGVAGYMNGMSPEAAYVSGNELYGRGQALAQAFSNSIRSVPESARLAMEEQYWEIVSQYGPDSEQAKAFMGGVIEAIPELDSQVQEIMDNSGIYSEGFTEEDRDRAERYIIEGMQAGLSGETKVEYMQNRAYGVIPPSGDSEGIPETSYNTNLNTYKGAPVNLVPRRDYEQAVSDYEAYSGLMTGDNNSDYMYIEAEVDGQMMLVSPELAAMMVYDEDPERYNELREEYRNSLIKYADENNLWSTAYTMSTINDLVNSKYPKYSEKQSEKIKRRDKERFQALADKYSYISDDPINNVRIGTAIRMSEVQISPTRFNFDKETTAGFSIDDRNYINRITNGRVFKYDKDNQSVGKLASEKEIAALLEADNRYYSIDSEGRVCVTDGTNYYYLEGSVDDVKRRRGIQGRMDGLLDFSRDGYNIDGVSVPGIGTSEERAVMPEFVSLNWESWKGKNLFEDFNIEGVPFTPFKRENMSPIMAGGNVIGYVLVVNDASGVPHKIVTTETGVCIGVSNPYSFMGSEPQMFLEDIINVTYDTEKKRK